MVWDAILFVNLAVPVTAFAESFNHEPKWNNREKAYIWAYDVVVGLNRYDVELLGSLEGSYVNWEMRLSQRNGFQDFVWFTGVSASNRTGGRWNLNRTPDNPEPYLEIDWYNDFAGEAWVKYTNIIPGAPENGAFIQYGTNLDPDFDRYYQIETIQNNKTTEIEWNYDNKNGRVRDEVQFGDTLWHCWDTALLDVNC